MTSFQIDYVKLEHKPQQHQLSVAFEITIEQVFETLETAGIYMKKTVLQTWLNQF